MMQPVILKCGCAANSKVSAMDGVKYDPPIDGCAVHDCITPAEVQPNLKDRLAKCVCGKTDNPNERLLAFFEYKGPGSRYATEMCSCGFYRTAHTNKARVSNKNICSEFNPRGPAEFDRYYCGHYGWD